MKLDDARFGELLVNLSEGASLMDSAGTESEKLDGARLVSEVGAELVKVGGKPLLEKAHSMTSEDNQRTIELQWFGLTDADGRQWLP